MSLLQKRTRIKSNIPFTITHSRIVSQIQNKSVQINLGNSYFGKLTKKAFFFLNMKWNMKKILYILISKNLHLLSNAIPKISFRIFSNFFFKKNIYLNLHIRTIVIYHLLLFFKIKKKSWKQFSIMKIQQKKKFEKKIMNPLEFMDFSDWKCILHIRGKAHLFLLIISQKTIS